MFRNGIARRGVSRGGLCRSSTAVLGYKDGDTCADGGYAMASRLDFFGHAALLNRGDLRLCRELLWVGRRQARLEEDSLGPVRDARVLSRRSRSQTQGHVTWIP